MILDLRNIDGVEVVFSYSPAWEMFFSMHVLANPNHHVGRQKWAERITSDASDLVERVMELNERTRDWTFLIDAPIWNRLRQMEIAELLSYLRKKNICRWNQMLEYVGITMKMGERDRVLDVIQEYYDRVFKREETLLRSCLLRLLEGEIERCYREGFF